MTTTPHLDFFNHYRVQDLANGCQIAGAEVLTNMCAALAGVAHPDSCLINPETGQKFPIGINTLTTSPLSAGFLADCVIAPIRRLQDQYLDNTASRAAFRLLSEPVKIGVPSKWKESPTHATGEATPIDAESFARSDPRDTRWLSERLDSQIHAEACMRPSIIFEGGDPKLLSRQLLSCHLRKPLVTLRITDARAIPQSDSIYQAVMHGVALDGDRPRVVRGNILTATTIPIFNELLQNRPNCEGILESSLWLPGTSFGDSTPPKGPQPQTPSLQSQYEAALERTVSARLKGQPTLLHIAPGTAEACRHFAAYLQTLDTRLPGISASLRSLIPSLIFGVSVLLKNCNGYNPKAITTYDPIFSGLARTLALRMVEYRESLLHTERMERLRHIATSILGKLEGGPQSPRELTRRFDRLTIPECREALDHLASTGAAAITDDGRWHLVSRQPSVTTIELNPQS